MDYSFHEIANVFPMLVEPELEDLADDIDKHGLHHPIVLFEGKILDGRNRYTACNDVGYELTETNFTTFTGTWDDAVDYVVSENLRRRHLDESQRAMAATRLARLRQGRPEINRPIGRFTQADAARQLSVGERSVRRARVVDEQGVPELVKLVDAGEISVSAASEVAKEPKPLQRKLIEKFDSEDAEEREEARRRLREHVRNRPIQPLSPTEKAIRRGSKSSQILTGLVHVVRMLETMAEAIAGQHLTFTPDAEGTALMAVDRIQSGADWIRTLITGQGFSDEALTDWLSQED